MKLQELLHFLSSSNILRDWSAVGEDNNGQLIIYTGLTCDEDDNLLPFGEDE